MYVQIKELGFSYKNSEEAVIKNFSLEISQGEIISILGASGSGKSTVLRLIAGLETPHKGSIAIRGKVMVDGHTFLQPEKRGVGMVFQDYALFPHKTVEGNIKFGLKELSKEASRKRVDEVLKLVELVELKGRYPFELSGGQQQRVALARALAPNPSLLLLDEPFSNLDKELQLKIREELKVILKQTGTTVIFVTHDKEDAKALADRVVVLKKGNIIDVGHPTTVL